MTHTADDMHDSPVTPSPVGEVLDSNYLMGMLPCPFCGSAACIFDRNGHLYACCTNDDKCGAEVLGSRDIVLAKAAWNRRTPPSDTSGEAVAWRFRLLTHFRDDEWEVAARRPEFTTASAQKLVELEPLYPASALAAAEARGRHEALLQAEVTAYSVPNYWNGEKEPDGIMSPGSPYDRGRFDAARGIRALINASEPLSPAHKGSEND